MPKSGNTKSGVWQDTRTTQNIASELDIARECQTLLTGSTADLLPADVKPEVLERVIGKALIKFYVERGTRFPLHTSGPGKVMLAFMPEAERDEVIAGMKFERFQPWTISNRKDFLKCLDDVRKKGWAVDAGEHLEGHHCLGAPILDAEGNAGPQGGTGQRQPLRATCDVRR